MSALCKDLDPISLKVFLLFLSKDEQARQRWRGHILHFVRKKAYGAEMMAQDYFAEAHRNDEGKWKGKRKGKENENEKDNEIESSDFNVVALWEYDGNHRLEWKALALAPRVEDL